MRTNVLNDLSNVVKKGTGLACSWSQVGRMSEGAPDEHPMSIRSASDGERWKPAGEKGSTRVWKHVAMIFAVLVLSIANIGMAWADTELANINFKSWTPQSISAGSTVNGCYFKSAVTISAANGATFGGNASTSANYVAIPLSGINGSITITLTHASGRPQWKNYFKGLNATPSSSDLSGAPSSMGDNTRPGSNTTTSSWTISTDKMYGVFYVGRGSNGQNNIYSISISTPDWTYYYRGADNDWGGTEMTKSSEGFYSYKSSSTNNHQFKIAKSSSTWDYNYSFVDPGYLGTSISTIGDYGSDNCYIWSAPASYYIIVFRPGSVMNTTANPKICASATLPAEKFTISFNNGGGSGSMSSISNVLYGSDKATTANTFTKAGYRFTGWHADVDVKVGGATKTAGTLLDDEVTIQEIKSDITLTAQWEVDDGCNKIFWFANSADATTNGVTNNTTTFGGVNTGTTAVTGSITIDGKTYTATGRGSNNRTTITFTVPASKVGTLYGLANSSGNSARTLTLTNTDSYSETQSTSASSSTAGAFTFEDMPAGSYSLAWSGNGAENMLCLKLCDAAAVCSATQPGAISKGTLSSCSLPLTASGSPASNNTWYWQASSTGTSTSESGATKNVNSTGTYYIRSYCSENGGCWSEAQSVTVSASDLTPAAPTVLAAASPTAKGVTLTVTDAANTNDYEFYVNTSSSAPSAGTSASYTSTSKSVTITDKYAGTTFYAWARAKCGSNKSAWTALTGNTFTTSQVTVTHTLTNVTATSGATGANAAGGSDYTAVFAAVSGYSLPAPAITIDGNAAESGTDYTWTQGTGTVVIHANKITGNIVITIASAAAAPSSVAISGEWLKFAGETMTLTATPTGGNGPVTYQWYYGGKADGNAIEDATNATFSKTCAFSDAGSYYCKVTCGGSESTWGQNGDAYEVKVPHLYVKTGRNDGVKSDFGDVDFTRVDASTATASMTLGANWDYCYNIADGCGHYYGNAGTMQYNNYGPWVTNVNNQDCGLHTTNGATYVFTINYSNWSQLTTTVTFPSSNQAADKVIYFDNSERQWTNVYYRIGHTTHVQASAMDKVYGTANLYTFTTTEYNNFMGWHITNATGETGSNTNIYNTVNSPAITYATAHEGGAVTQSAVTVTPTTSRGTGSDTGINDNCTFYNYDITNGMKTDNVAITAPSNGTITVSYTDVNNAAQSFTSGNRDLAHTVILTSVTATPATGYDLSTLTISDGSPATPHAHTNGNSYTCFGATTIAATFALHNYNVTYSNPGNGNNYTIKVADGSATSASKTATMGQTITIVATPATGYDFTGWTISKAGGGTVTPADASATTTTFTMPTDNVTITASFTLKTYTVTYNAGSGAGISGSHANDTKTYGVNLTLPGVTFTRTGYTQTGWATSDGGSQAYALSGSYTTNAAANLYPVWTAKTTTITINANTANHGSTTPGTVTATWGSALPSFSAATGVSSWSLIGYYTAATGGNKIINADGTLVASTTYADGSGHWNSEAATLTLYAQYEEVCTPQTISKVVLTAVDAGTVSGYNENEYAGAAVIGGLKSTNTAEVDASHAGVETGYKLNDNGKGIVFATLAKGTFQVGDVIKVTITYPNDNHTFAAPVSSKEALELFYGTNKDDATSLTILTGVSAAGTYSYTLTAADVTAIGSKKGIGVFRHSDRKQNPFVYSVEIYGCRDWVIEEEGLVNWTMNLNTNTWGTSSTSTTDETNISSISTSANTTDGTREGTTKKINLASAADNVNNAASFTFSLNSAKKIEPEKVTCKVFNVGDDEGLNYKAQLSDDNGHVYYSTNTVIPNTEATLTDAVFNFASDLILTGDITVKVYCWKSSGSGSAFRMGPKIRFFGEVQSAADYTVTHTLSNVTKSAGATSVKEGNNYTATYAGVGGYTLPSTISVTIGGSPATAGTDYTWTQGTGVVSIPGNKVTGNIVITVTGDEPAVTHNVTFSLTNVVYSSGDNQGTGAATEGSAFSTVFAASSGYSLPGTITVTIGGVAQTAGTGYTWAQGSGTLTIPAAYVTGDIVVTIVGEEMEGDGCDELVHTEAATATSLSTSVGTATLYNPSSQSKNSKAIKLNSSGYIELSPKAGKSFAAGDSLIVVVYNQATSGKTTGFKIGTDTYTASIAASSNHTFRQKLTSDNIVSSKVKIERESSDGWFVSAIIKHCEDLPSCTTPTLPSLSDQELCPRSDIAAWDATPTNIATITGASEDVAYSWKKKGSDTELAATASFDLGSSATEGMAGTYVVTVTVSKTGYITKSASAEVDLTVTPATETPSVTASKAKVYATDEVTLTATCGSTGVTWNWYLCANSDGTGAGSSLGTSATYTIASAPAAGTYYYKAVATGDGTHSCGTAEYVYTLVVSAANSCDKEFWFAKEGDRPTGAAAATHITGCPSGSSSASYTASIDGTNYTLTGSTGQKTGNVTIVVPADNTGTLYVVVQGSSSRTITLSKGGTQIGQETPENSTWGVFTFDNLDAGTYTLVSSGNISWAMMALKLCPTVACTDDTPTAAATNATVCAGGTITITATGYETGATFQWQKQNASTSVWENIDGATSDTYTVATAAAEHAGNYHIVATKGCARTSNTVTIAVPSAPVFNSFTTTRRIMETQALSISDVSATDAVSYTWYKSSDATWDAGDTEIGTSKNLLKPYDGETAGSTYYVICRAANSCGTTTSSAITVTVQTLVEEDCAIAGNSGEHNTFAKTGSVSSGTYGSITELHTNSNNKYIYYTAESGYYFATATVNACVGNASDLPTAAYSYSTDGGANWTDQNLTGMTTAYADHVINLPANVNAFRVGRRLGDCGISSNTIYIHQVCFTYNENCTKTTVDPSETTIDHEIGDSFTEPTFTVKSSGVALSPQPTITYTSSDETVATVDDDGTVNFQDKAGTVVITAAYAGDATYCDSEGSYTITVSCSDEAPKIIAAAGTNIGGCNDEITLEAKKQDGTTNFSDGTYQWYRDGEAISGATGRTYTVSLTGVYSVERTSVGGCVSPSSNKATVTSESAEPEVERLTPFQYYHVDKVYAETSIMRFRNLFAVRNAGTTLEGKHFKMELSRNGGAATDVTNSNAFVMSASADTVLLDMNKLYGKYEEDDELVLTCSAVDCEGNVSSIYKNTITIYVIDETPTLALICSGASGDGTRKTSNLVVGGDFLTGYNKADLCVQTGNTSFDKTQEWVLYTRLKENYIVTPVNGYAEFNKLNYEPFDILFLTDYPKASKSDAAATILDDMADLCDYRPLFTFKTHMVHKSPSKWAAKGFMAQPEVPKQSRLRLNIVCYAHPMFDDLKEVSDQIQKDASDHSQIVYTMLTGPGHESSKGMQGFPIDAAEGFVTIGLVHYDATAADDTPSEGYVTWTPESDDVMLVAAAERQVNLEARMILFSINCGAQSKLTETGRQVVLRSLEYLLSDATITPVADCSFTFTNGAGNDWTYEQYKAKCPACTGTIGDGKWSTAGNWGPDWILQPGKDTEVKIAAPVTVDMPHAKVRTVRILEGGSIDIPAGSGLEVGSTIRRLDGTELSPTEVVDLSIGSTSSGNGTLIFNNNFGDTKARVDMYSNALADVANMSAATSTWQYIGTPHSDVASATHNYYNSWLYQYSGSGWEVIPNGGPLVPFRGYCVTHPDAPVVFGMEGTLVATTTQDIAIPAGYTVIANSWVAPIDISTFTDDDMENISDKTIYFFNTGSDAEGNHGTGTEAGTYVAVPKNSASYVGTWQIPSMQGFYISTETAGTLHLDYDRHVRPTGSRSVVSNPMYAPRRAAAESNEPNVLKIFARGSRYQDKLVVLEREDFTRGYDSGWDGEAWGGGTLSPMVYVIGEGREDAVSAIPEFEGTVVAFKAGEDSEYRFEFIYDGDESLYLFDTENNTYTQIMTGESYFFSTDDKAPHSRFILTRKAPQIATGTELTSDGEGANAKKLLIEDKMYILLNGMLYDATGKVVK